MFIFKRERERERQREQGRGRERGHSGSEVGSVLTAESLTWGSNS